MQRLKEVCVFGVFMLLCLCCAKDQLKITPEDCDENYTFANQVKPIIDRSCAYSGCHDGSGSAPGNFQTYENLLPYLNPSKFENRAVTQRDMPPVFSVGPELSSVEIKAFKCWIENNYQER